MESPGANMGPAVPTKCHHWQLSRLAYDIPVAGWIHVGQRDGESSNSVCPSSARYAQIT
jgi:hypothetical protein